MPRTEGQTRGTPRAVGVSIHSHTKQHDPKHAETLGRYRISMKQNDTFADVGLKALQRFRQEKPDQGRLVEVDIIMDSDYYLCALTDQLETLKDGEALHVFLTEPSSALSQKTPDKSPANPKGKPTQTAKGPATPNPPKPAESASSNPGQPAQASGRMLRSSTKPKETSAVAAAATAPPPQIYISSDSSSPGSEDTDCVIVGENRGSTQKPSSTPAPVSKTPPTLNNDAPGSRKASFSLPKNRTLGSAVRVKPQGIASPLKADALRANTKSTATSKSQTAASQVSSAPSYGKIKKDVYEISSDDEGSITPQQSRNLRTRSQASQDGMVPPSPLPQKAASERATSPRQKLLPSPAKVISINDSGYSLSNESDDEIRGVAKTPDSSYTVKNTRGLHSVSRRKGSSAQRGTATGIPSSSGVAMTGSSPCTRTSTRRSGDLVRQLGEFTNATKKRLEEEATAAAAAAEAAMKEQAEAKARSKRGSTREVIDQIKKMTNRRTEPKPLMEEIPDSFFEDTDLSDDHLGDDIIYGPSQSQSQSSNATATPKDQTPRFKGKRSSHPAPTTSFTPVNTLYPEYETQPQSQIQPGHMTGKSFGLNYPKHFRDRFSDAEQSDDEDNGDDRSVGSEGERFWRGEVLGEDGLPKAFKEYSWKYPTQFVSLGQRGYTYVGDGPWEGLILSGRHRGKYLFGCEPPTNEQIAEEEENAEPRVQTQDWEEEEEEEKDQSDVGTNNNVAEQVELPPCSLNLDHMTPNHTTPTPQGQSGQDVAKVSDDSDLRSADSEASSVLIRRQLEAECPPSNQQLGILMSSSPSKTPTIRSNVASNHSPSVRTGDVHLGQSDEDTEDTPRPVSKLVVNNSGLSEGKKATIKKVTFSDQVNGEKDDGNEKATILPYNEPPAKTIAFKTPEDDTHDDESLMPPKPLAEITASAISDDGEDGNEGSQDSDVLALKYVLQESPRWLSSLTTTGQAQDNSKGLEQQLPASSISKQRQKSEPPPSSAPPRLRSYTPIPLPVIPTFTAATQSQIATEGPRFAGVGLERKRLTSEPPGSALQATASKRRSFTPVPPPIIPVFSGPALVGLDPVADDPFMMKEVDSAVQQEQPKLPETPLKARSKLSDSHLLKSAVSSATSPISTSNKRRHRDDEDEHSEEPAEEWPSRKKHKTKKYHKKDKLAREHCREEQQQQVEDSHDGGETAARDASDTESVQSSLQHACKNDKQKKKTKKRKHHDKHDKTLDKPTTSGGPAELGESSSRKKPKSSKKHRKSVEQEETPTRKKRKHSRDGDDSLDSAAAATTNAPVPTPQPPTAVPKHAASSSTSPAIKAEEGLSKGSRSPLPLPPSSSSASSPSAACPRRGKGEKAKRKNRTEKNRRDRRNHRRRKLKKRLGQYGSKSAPASVVGT
ncbi:hypothetical protein PG990_014549 [Apiospora arundinis]